MDVRDLEQNVVPASKPAVLPRAAESTSVTRLRYSSEASMPAARGNPRGGPA